MNRPPDDHVSIENLEGKRYKIRFCESEETVRVRAETLLRAYQKAVNKKRFASFVQV